MVDYEEKRSQRVLILIQPIALAISKPYAKYMSMIFRYFGTVTGILVVSYTTANWLYHTVRIGLGKGHLLNLKNLPDNSIWSQARGFWLCPCLQFVVGIK